MSDMRRTAVAFLAAALCACAGGKDNLDITKPITGAEATNADKAYRKGLAEKNGKNYLEATRYLEWVRNNFPYSQYSALSELALADMAYERDDYGSAAGAYQDFVKSHPSHPQAAYASFRIGLARYQDKPSDFWLMPPSDEKDQSSIRQALDALQKFVATYPKSEYVPKAREMIADCRERLAAHERYVADFYRKRNRWRGAVGRLMTLADTYGDLDGGKVRARALWEAGEAYRNLNDPADERKVLQRLVQEAPQSEHRHDAEARLRALPSDAPPPPKPQPPQPGSALSGGTQPPNTNLPEPTSTPPRPSPTPTEPQPAQPGGAPSQQR
jgi:outer membrane protein assembly factor BamD